MTHCPKCSSHRIAGPAFGRGPYGGEHLRYTCVQCGYSETTSTHDAAEKEDDFAEFMKGLTHLSAKSVM